jgi:hypothetical protein
MAKNTKQTSPKVASQASKILRDPKSTKAEKSVAASDFSQTGGKKKKWLVRRTVAGFFPLPFVGV